MNTELFFFVFIVVLLFITGSVNIKLYEKVLKNEKRINDNLSYIKKNKELISQNSHLIHLINVMLSNSSLKVDWDKYKAKLNAAGIFIPENNLDIEDPEG